MRKRSADLGEGEEEVSHLGVCCLYYLVKALLFICLPTGESVLLLVSYFWFQAFEQTIVSLCVQGKLGRGKAGLLIPNCHHEKVTQCLNLDG